MSQSELPARPGRGAAASQSTASPQPNSISPGTAAALRRFRSAADTVREALFDAHSLSAGASHAAVQRLRIAIVALGRAESAIEAALSGGPQPAAA